MKALLRFPGERKIALADCPIPSPGDHDILVQTRFSLISPGTEFSQVRQSKASLYDKAWQRPDLVALTLKSLTTDGIGTTISRVHNRLARPIPMGYCAIGRICAIGQQAQQHFTPDQRVAIAGIGTARHAQWNRVPMNLACPVPDAVSDQKAAFTTLYALALHSLRQGKTMIGDRILIMGAGLIGQLIAQCAQASGTIADIIEPDTTRRQIAQTIGVRTCFAQSKEAPSDIYDAVYLCAPAYGSHPLIDEAARLSRDRATIICVGDVGISGQRKPLCDKEITIKQVRSYGPGRYDPAYEELGQDYPLGYVRWTLKRNMQAALELMKDGRLDPTSLITSEIAFDDIADHFAKGPQPDQLATLVRYFPVPCPEPTAITDIDDRLIPSGAVKIGLIGTGNYAGSGLLPQLVKQDDVEVTACCSRDGVSAMALARKLPNAKAVSSVTDIITAPNINTVIIATRHDSHATLAASAMATGKHIWLEKPVAIRADDIDLLRNQLSSSPRQTIFMVGHNRRYAPMSARLRDALPAGPKHFRYRVRLSPLARDHWLHHPTQGGRTIGEISHFIDLIASLTPAELSDIHCHWLDRKRGDSIWTVHFSDGSRGDISYQHTNRRDTKEILQIDAPDFDAQLTDWRKLVINGQTVMRQYFGQDKGQQAAINNFVKAISTGIPHPLMPGIRAEIKLMSEILKAAGC